MSPSGKKTSSRAASQKPPIAKDLWRYIGIGSFIGLVFTVLFFKKIYCFYVYQPAGITMPAGLGILGTLIGAITKLVSTRLKSLVRQYENLIFAFCSMLIMAALVIFISPLIYHLDKNVCVENFSEFVNLIDQEGDIVIKKDMNGIRDIYASNAIVTNATTGESWPALIYYSNKFAHEDHCTNTHGHYEVIEFTSDEVTITTSSQGTWGYIGQGCNQIFDNPPGSNAWTFQKITGEWKIINFNFK